MKEKGRAQKHGKRNKFGNITCEQVERVKTGEKAYLLYLVARDIMSELLVNANIVLLTKIKYDQHHVTLLQYLKDYKKQRTHFLNSM